MDELNFDFIDNAINAAADIENNAFNNAMSSFDEMNQRNEDYFSSNAETDAGKSFDAYQKSLQRNMNNLTADALMSQTGMSRADAELLAKTPEAIQAKDAKSGNFDFKIGDKPEGGWAKATTGERHEAMEKTGKNLRELPKNSKEYAENVGDILEYLEESSKTRNTPMVAGMLNDYYKLSGREKPSGATPKILDATNVRKNIKDIAYKAANDVFVSGDPDAGMALANRMTDKQKSEMSINKVINNSLKDGKNTRAILAMVADPVKSNFIDQKTLSAVNKKFANPKSEVDAIEALSILNDMGENVSDLAKTLKANIESEIKENNWRTSLSKVTEEKPVTPDTPTKPVTASDSIAETYNRKKLSEYYDPKGPTLTDEEVKGMAKTLGKQFIANLKEGRVRKTLRVQVEQLEMLKL